MGYEDHREASQVWISGTETPGAGNLCQTPTDMLGDLGCYGAYTIKEPELGGGHGNGWSGTSGPIEGCGTEEVCESGGLDL